LRNSWRQRRARCATRCRSASCLLQNCDGRDKSLSRLIWASYRRAWTSSPLVAAPRGTETRAMKTRPSPAYSAARRRRSSSTPSRSA
jgi:hypothetical protein